jgi:predicted DCC family thiol-disulfide oxidoreductase YuxK
MGPGADRPVVVYDGSCSFCRRWVARLQMWDRHGRLDYVTLQDRRAEVLTGRPRAVLKEAAHVVIPSGEVVQGAAAFRAICRYLPWGWLPGAVLGLPGMLPLAERMYRGIARRWGPVGAGPCHR